MSAEERANPTQVPARRTRAVPLRARRNSSTRRWTRRGIVAVFAIGSASVLPLSSATAQGTITLYSGTGLTYPHHVVTGPNGNLWFTNNGDNDAGANTGSIGEMQPGGTLVDLHGCTSPCDITNPHGITVGPDGNLWFVNKSGGGSPVGSVGKITTGGTITIYNDSAINAPNNIAVGPDANLWITNTGNDTISKMSTNGSVLATYGPSGINHPKGITAGYDGAMWFANFGNEPNACTTGNACGIGPPVEIVSGPDGALWFANAALQRAARSQTRTRARRPARQ